MQGASGCVWRGSSCLLTRVLLCLTNVLLRPPPHVTGQQRRRPWRPRLDRPGIGLGGSTKHLSCSSSLPQTTCTRKHMHAHMHICTDVEPPSAPAAPCLAPPCLPPFLPPWPTILSMQSLWPPTTTSTFPLLPGTVVSRLPLGFQRVSLCSQPGEHAAFSGVVGLVAHLPGLTGTWALGRLVLHPTGSSAQGEASYQVATPLPLSSRAFPVGRTRSRTGSVSDGQPYFFCFCFWGLFNVLFPVCTHSKSARGRTL